MKRINLILVASALTLATIVWLASRGVGQTPVSLQPSTYRPDAIAANGTIEGATPEVALRPDVAGTIKVIALRENQRVKKGDLLAELHNEAQKQQAALAKAELSLAEAQLDQVHNGERTEKRRAMSAQEAARKAVFEQANKQWERAKRLMSTSAISRDEYDAALHQMQRAKEDLQSAAAESALVEAPPRQDELDAAVARVEAAKARFGLAQAELAKTRILAPADGCVLQVFAEPGDQAGPATSRPVILFADLSRFRVRAFVEELDAPRVQVGQKVTMTADGLPGKTFTGTVKVVLSRMGKRAPHSDAPGEYHDVYYREVMVDLDQCNGLVVNLRAVVRIAVGTEQ